MAAKAAEEALRIIDGIVSGIHGYAATGRLDLALVTAFDQLIDVVTRVARDPEARRTAMIVAGLGMVIVGAVLIIEDLEDFLVDWSRFHHWMLGMVLVFAGLALLALAA